MSASCDARDVGRNRQVTRFWHGGQRQKHPAFAFGADQAEGARAAIGGLDAAERDGLARREVSEAVRGVALNPDHTTIEVREDAGRLRVVVVYDASDSLIMALGGMLPRPPSVIRRSAVIHVGDY